MLVPGLMTAFQPLKKLPGQPLVLRLKNESGQLKHLKLRLKKLNKSGQLHQLRLKKFNQIPQLLPRLHQLQFFLLPMR